MRYVLVTGSTGFIGSHLCEALTAQGIKVRTLDRNPDNQNVDSFKMDLAKEECPADLMTGIDTVFHLAGKAYALAEGKHDEEDYYQTNTIGTLKLLLAAKQAGVERFIFFSSVKAVGDDGWPMNESAQKAANTPYGISKFMAEQLVLGEHKLPHSTVIRPCMVYGNSHKGNLPRMIKAIQRGYFPPLQECGNRRTMVHVNDVVHAALLAAENPVANGQTYIISDGRYYSTRQMVDLIRICLGKRPTSCSIPLWSLTMIARFGDLFAKCFHKRFPLDSDSLDKLIGSAWYYSNKAHRELYFDAEYSLPTAMPEIIAYLNSR